MYECEQGWLLFRDSCYLFESNAKAVIAAENYCVGKDSHLASIHSTNEMNFLRDQKIFNSDWVWIGGEKNGNSFKWLDGTEFDYTNWDADQPNHFSNENCLLWKSLSSSTKWHDARCDIEKVFVCKKPASRKYFTFEDWKNI